MKKSLLALAVLGAFTGVASAQSSVTLFGIIDLSAIQVKNDGSAARTTLGNNGINSNRLGLKGIEDLGGGFQAGFWLEGAMSNDDGNAGGQTWQRRSTASLMGKFGEVRLGRDYTPSFWNTTIFDPFGTNGVASSLNVSRFVGQTTYVRSNNSVGYFLPAMGGLYGQYMHAFGEGAANAKYDGGRIGFAAGPFNVALAFGSQDVTASTKFKTVNLAGSYKVGPANLMAQWNSEKIDSTPEAKEVRILLGTAITIGQGEIRLAWVKSDDKSAADADSTQTGIGYVYNLSPRTALYGQYATISNRNGANFTVQGGNAQPAAPTAGGRSTGLQAGLRHSF